MLCWERRAGRVRVRVLARWKRQAYDLQARLKHMLTLN